MLGTNSLIFGMDQKFELCTSFQIPTLVLSRSITNKQVLCQHKNFVMSLVLRRVFSPIISSYLFEALVSTKKLDPSSFNVNLDWGS